MKRILKNMKPFILLVLVAISLLFVQAWADLKLPNYMSDIVNVGIQQSGIEHASPEVMSKNGYDLIAAVLPETQSNAFKNAYTVSGNEAVINDDVDRKEIDVLVGESIWTLMNYEIPGTEPMNGQMSEDFNITDLYPAIPLFESLDNSIKETAFAKAEETQDSLKAQTGVMVAKMLYEEQGTDISTLQRDYIFKTGLQMLGITFVGVIAAVLVGLSATRTGAGFSRNLRREVFEKIQGFSSAEFNKFSQSSMVVRSANDVTQVQMMIMMSIRIFFYAPIMAIGGIVMIQNKADSMTWLIGAACAALFVVLLFIYFVAMPKFKIRQSLVDRLNLVFRENLSGVMVMRAFGNTDFENKRFEKANVDVADLTLFVNRVMSIMMPIMMLIMNMTVVGIIWFGAGEVSNGIIQIGDMMAFMQYAMQIIMAFLMISMMFIFIPRAMVSLNRINEILETENSIEDPQTSLPFDDTKRGVVEFDNVSFKYDGADEYVLKDISFTARPGQTTAFIGSTGSGKSTLINLIPRFYDASEGVVRVDGVDVRDIDQKTLREDIGYIPQKGILLSGTVEENLKYGNQGASDEQVLKALEIAQGNFILDKEEGLQYRIAQGGTNVSGGQRQRLSIARALVRDASIYIFDDSFSALDFKTDQLLRKAIHENYEDATLMIVAQRVNTIIDADQIIVLDEGKMVGIGTHQELLKSSATYYEIAASQLSEEELNYGKK
ncbi:ABC transporter ATP-binding protein [Erysipelothrix sp. HDW6B]|uniref:ABC transporter ATP-binding protein n=1 Tax=Erysipelothrix sp. HDW6B TaxID=2714929 RepID=UPI00140C67CB|nr:ABC transporter ATP-binding protein [Erysipelothrix sp. HDW6B]QIK85360.1 ABC transporter ATP-binding protein [Erysipelothrix sp. HDW6B]